MQLGEQPQPGIGDTAVDLLCHHNMYTHCIVTVFENVLNFKYNTKRAKSKFVLNSGRLSSSIKHGNHKTQRLTTVTCTNSKLHNISALSISN